MNRTPTVDTQSPWYETFTQAQAAPGLRWLPNSSAAPAPTIHAAPGQPEAADDQWVTEALFDCYND